MKEKNGKMGKTNRNKVKRKRGSSKLALKAETITTKATHKYD